MADQRLAAWAPTRLWHGHRISRAEIGVPALGGRWKVGELRAEEEEWKACLELAIAPTDRVHANTDSPFVTRVDL